MAIAIDTRQRDFLEMDNAKISREHLKIMLISGMGSLSMLTICSSSVW
jgi:MFS transporter, PHS family, inorganic phosphate transporter